MGNQPVGLGVFHTVCGGIDPPENHHVFVSDVLGLQMYARVYVLGWNLILPGWRNYYSLSSRCLSQISIQQKRAH